MALYAWAKRANRNCELLRPVKT
ncbi:hypothetical protein CCACVL1_12441 [Corchorus capsularis]|uniref:Uncharacterized protein n=1 Tax=Corchorus capsularis TaxID=210143 RepID=A0A1R3IFL1_COCAP|nr:hypothetical protein CCACVL1_12441 [Corchorus capsularis]